MSFLSPGIMGGFEILDSAYKIAASYIKGRKSKIFQAKGIT